VSIAEVLVTCRSRLREGVGGSGAARLGTHARPIDVGALVRATRPGSIGGH
jgi:hypothetical protein